jgi:hypothetical protein
MQEISMSNAAAKNIRAKRAEKASTPGTQAHARPAAVRVSTEPNVAEIAASVVCRRDQLRHAIAEAAYYRAQSRGFASGQEREDWLAAEAEILGM